MATTNNLFSFQGKIFTAKRNDKGEVDYSTKVWLGNAKEATVEISVDKEDLNESFSGNRALYGSLITKKSGTLNLNLTEWTPESLALGLFAKQVKIASKTVTKEEFPSGLAVGDIIKLDGLFVSEVEIKDGASKALVEGQDYEVVSSTSGEIKILKAIASQPLSAAYKTSDINSLAFLSEVQAPERFVIFEGVDTINGKKVYMELYRVQFDPVDSLGLINESFGELAIKGSLLVDSERLNDSLLGGYARIVTKE